MSRAANYFLSLPGHTLYLIPSIYTLRQFYSGDIEVFAYPESYDLVKKISNDPRLGIEPILLHPKYKRQVIDRFEVSTRPGRELRLYLDADITFHGEIDRLFREAERVGLVMTQYGKFLISRRIIHNRVSRLKKYKAPNQINQKVLEELLKNPYPAINGGVYACRTDSHALHEWYRYTQIIHRQNIPDELCSHVIYLEHRKEVEVLPGKYNMAARFWEGGPDTRIRHYSGQCCLRYFKSPRSFRRWWNIFEFCLEQNFGCVQEWWQKLNNPFLKECIALRESHLWEKLMSPRTQVKLEEVYGEDGVLA